VIGSPRIHAHPYIYTCLNIHRYIHVQIHIYIYRHINIPVAPSAETECVSTNPSSPPMKTGTIESSPPPSPPPEFDCVRSTNCHVHTHTHRQEYRHEDTPTHRHVNEYFCVNISFCQTKTMKHILMKNHLLTHVMCFCDTKELFVCVRVYIYTCIDVYI